jgi:hypothetical protein
MPGRRVPRVPPEEAASRHVAAAFGGGLRGAASVPAPTGGGAGALAGQAPNGQQREVRFATDTFPIATLVDADLGVHAPGYAYYPDTGSGGIYPMLRLSHRPIYSSVVIHVLRRGRVLNVTWGQEMYSFTKIDLGRTKSFDNGPDLAAPSWWIQGRLPRVEPGDAFAVQYAYYPDDDY